MPFVSRTRATLRSAEFGFFGVCVNTRTQTPRFCGLTCSAGLFVLVTIFLRPWRTSCLIVGIDPQNGVQPKSCASRSIHPRRLRAHNRHVAASLKTGRANARRLALAAGDPNCLCRGGLPLGAAGPGSYTLLSTSDHPVAA